MDDSNTFMLVGDTYSVDKINNDVSVSNDTRTVDDKITDV